MDKETIIEAKLKKNWFLADFFSPVIRIRKAAFRADARISQTGGLSPESRLLYSPGPCS